ncbi:MAG: hypothetical protein H7A23_10955 [Leptospiraceae bacterium]|nr:hypothetical protein [Leptospiraceae bacterium]MCP5495064.1 hypothetical protein [Leptospiraceae bacterium]
MERKPFNRYKLEEAYHLLGIEKLKEWEISCSPIQPTEIFQQSLRRMEAFDIKHSEAGKEILIDRILEEALSRKEQLKIWKEAHLETELVRGRVEYLFAKRIDLLKRPFLCLAEAKKDDFEKGLAQCLVEMKACQILNQNAGYSIDIYGIVTNAVIWQFYKLSKESEVYQSLPYNFPTQTNILFGILDTILQACEESLSMSSIIL